MLAAQRILSVLTPSFYFLLLPKTKIMNNYQNLPEWQKKEIAKDRAYIEKMRAKKPEERKLPPPLPIEVWENECEMDMWDQYDLSGF
jgi:hypothetical protein